MSFYCELVDLFLSYNLFFFKEIELNYSIDEIG